MLRRRLAISLGFTGAVDGAGEMLAREGGSLGVPMLLVRVVPACFAGLVMVIAGGMPGRLDGAEADGAAGITGRGTAGAGEGIDGAGARGGTAGTR